MAGKDQIFDDAVQVWSESCANKISTVLGRYEKKICHLFLSLSESILIFSEP